MVSGGTGAMDEGLRREIEGLRKLKTKALKARYREVFGEPSRHPTTRTCSGAWLGGCRLTPKET
jgi:hypothetical protein